MVAASFSEVGPDGAVEPPPLWLKGLAVILALATVTPYTFVFFYVPHLSQLFDAFGGRLPFATELLLATYRFLGLLSLVAVVPAFRLLGTSELARARQYRLLAFVLFGFALSLIVFYFCVYGIYAPILEMGAIGHGAA